MKKLLAVAVLVWVSACQAPPAEMTEAEMGQIEAGVLQWAEAWVESSPIVMPEDRCEAWRNLAHPDHVVWMRGGEPRGRDGFLEYCLANQANWRGYTGEWTETNVRILSPDAVILIGQTSGTWVHADGRVIRYPAGVVRFLLERTADGWGFTMQDFSNGPSEVVEGG